MLTDIGVNLTHDSFDDDRDAVIQRARAAGVNEMIITGADLDSSRQAVKLCESLGAGFFATAGVHPHHASSLDTPSLEAIGELLGHPRVVAAGECGLDFFRNFSPPDRQQEAFESQLQLAVGKNKPVFLHQRDAHRRFIDILKPHLEHLPAAVVHCFTGTREELEECLALDLYVGITGWICDERRGKQLRELVREIPADRLMLETDAPYLLPRDLVPKPAGRRNEPMHLAHIAAVVAALRGEEQAQIAAVTQANARRFFGLASH